MSFSFSDVGVWFTIISTFLNFIGIVLGCITIKLAIENNFFGLFKDIMNDRLKENEHRRLVESNEQNEKMRENNRKHELAKLQIELKNLKQVEKMQKGDKDSNIYDLDDVSLPDIQEQKDNLIDF